MKRILSHFLLLSACIVLFAVTAGAQKASLTINYAGKVQQKPVLFSLSQGYAAGNSLKIGAAVFLNPEPLGSDKTKLTNYNQGKDEYNAKKYVVLNMPFNHATPQKKVSGIYYDNGKAFPFFLSKK